MGFWDSTLYDNDLALDVKEMFETIIDNKKSFAELYDIMVNTFHDCIISDEGPIFWLVFADCLWEYNLLSSEVKEKALSYIEQSAFSDYFVKEYDKLKWIESLNELKKKLLTPCYRKKQMKETCKEAAKVWNIGDIFAYKFIKESSNLLYEKYIIIQKVGDVVYGDTGISNNLIKVFNKVFDEIPKIEDVIDIPTLPLSLKFDYYDSIDITNEQKEIMEWNMKNSLYGELELDKNNDYIKYFSFIGKQENFNPINSNTATYLDLKTIEKDLYEYYLNWNDNIFEKNSKKEKI